MINLKLNTTINSCECSSNAWSDCYDNYDPCFYCQQVHRFYRLKDSYHLMNEELKDIGLSIGLELHNQIDALNDGLEDLEYSIIR